MATGAVHHGRRECSVHWRLPKSVASQPAPGPSLGASGPALRNKCIKINCLGSECEGYAVHRRLWTATESQTGVEVLSGCFPVTRANTDRG